MISQAQFFFLNISKFINKIEFLVIAKITYIFYYRKYI